MPPCVVDTGKATGDVRRLVRRLAARVCEGGTRTSNQKMAAVEHGGNGDVADGKVQQGYQIARMQKGRGVHDTAPFCQVAQELIRRLGRVFGWEQ
jgi:hypothetical protein